MNTATISAGLTPQFHDDGAPTFRDVAAKGGIFPRVVIDYIHNRRLQRVVTIDTHAADVFVQEKLDEGVDYKSVTATIYFARDVLFAYNLVHDLALYPSWIPKLWLHPHHEPHYLAVMRVLATNKRKEGSTTTTIVNRAGKLDYTTKKAGEPFKRFCGGMLKSWRETNDPECPAGFFKTFDERYNGTEMISVVQVGLRPCVSKEIKAEIKSAGYYGDRKFELWDTLTDRVMHETQENPTKDLTIKVRSNGNIHSVRNQPIEPSILKDGTFYPSKLVQYFRDGYQRFGKCDLVHNKPTGVIMTKSAPNTVESRRPTLWQRICASILSRKL